MYNLEELQKQFINLRLGTFIHFNSATMQFHTGDVIDWEFDHENNGKPRRYPFDEKDWNPSNLDCVQWASVAKSGGIRFAALTAKHHEGFTLWPTEYSEHSIKNGTNKIISFCPLHGYSVSKDTISAAFCKMCLAEVIDSRNLSFSASSWFATAMDCSTRCCFFSSSSS